MNNKDIEKKIHQAYKNATPDVLSSILEECEDMKGQNVYMEIQPKQRKIKYNRIVFACVLMLAIVAGVVTMNSSSQVMATISLDVNPSLEIKVNKSDKVLKVNTLNDDAIIVLGDMELEGSQLDVAVNALIGSMLQKGYINDLANSILISIDGSNPSTLQNRLIKDINSIIEANGMNGSIVTQTLVSNSDLEKRANEHNITFSKAQLIQSIVNQNNGYTFEGLVPLSIHELNVLISSNNNHVDTVNSTGQVSNKAYIGETKAKEIALKHVGVSESQIKELEIELDFDYGVMVYEVEFKTSTNKYEYEINAIDGTIVQVEKDGVKTESTLPDITGYLGQSAAKTIALKHAGMTESQAKNIDVDLEKDNGTPYYDIEFEANGYEYKYQIHAINGSIIKSYKEKDDSSNESSDMGYIGEANAKQIALNHAGITATSLLDFDIDLDNDHIYELKLKTNEYQFEYEIHAINGTIISVEKDANH